MKMYKIEVETIEELNVVERSLKEYKRTMQSDDEVEEFLKTKKFQMGDYVIKKGTSYFDGVFGTGNGEIGKIVGWDFEYGYYRVYYSDYNPYIGGREEQFEKYEGSVPSELYVKQPKEIRSIRVQLR